MLHDRINKDSTVLPLLVEKAFILISRQLSTVITNIFDLGTISVIIGRAVCSKYQDRRSYERAGGPSLHSEGVSKFAAWRVALFARLYKKKLVLRQWEAGSAGIYTKILGGGG